MEKRYQVFVSSTYSDLEEERKKITHVLLTLDCFPSGMEIFPAIDEEQFEFIKRVIDDCDYYLLIVGGKYGSLTSDGISYTEKEYDYAKEKGLKIIAFLNKDPENLLKDKIETDPDQLEKLKTFRDKVASNKLVKYWEKSEDLPALVALSLPATMKQFPAIGWMRANIATNQDSLKEINELQKENSSLKQKIIELDNKPNYQIDNLAKLDEGFLIKGTCLGGRLGNTWKVKTTWSSIFGLISPYLLQSKSADAVKQHLEKDLFKNSGTIGNYPHIDDQTYNTITLQFKALGLIDVKSLSTVGGGVALFWILTKRGEELMMQTRTVSSKL